MPAILRKLPFYEAETTLRIPGGPVVPIKHHQIVLWVSVTRPGLSQFPPNARRLPLLGMLGLRRADLQVFLDCRKCQVWMRTPRRFWLFG